MNLPLKLGVSGDVGSFSEEAGWLYASKNNMAPVLSYLLDMEGVLSAVEKGVVDLGIFPVVNLRGGLVRMAYDAMGRHLFKVIDELWLEVHQCLLVKSDVTAKQIKKIVSHPQAFAQCQKFLQTNYPEVEQVVWQDTAKAARDLAQGQLSSVSAVIAPMQAAEQYGLKVLAEDIQDDHTNLTAFIIVKKHADEVSYAKP